MNENLLAMDLLCGVLDALPQPAVLLGPGGTAVYVNTQGENTPISLRTVDYETVALVRQCLEGRTFSSRHCALSGENGRNMTGFLELYPVKTEESGVVGALLFFRPDASAALETPAHQLPYASEAMQAVAERVTRAAQVGTTVLFRGEKGVGCRDFAKAVHMACAVRERPFVEIDCRPEAFEAFLADTKAQFHAAGAGVCYLNGVDKLTQEHQSRLLSMVRAHALGGLLWEARLFSHTHRDLKEAVGQGAFSEDLLLRLSLLQVTVPALRERPEDIAPLCKAFLQKHATLQQKDLTGFSDEAWRNLSAYSWPGNLAELESVIKEAAARCPGGMIGAAHLPLGPYRPLSLHQLRSGFSRERIEALLEIYGRGVQGKRRTAKELGIGLSTLYRILAEK